MSNPLVNCEYKDDVAWITLNNPEQMNALSGAMLAELEGIVERLHQESGVRCVVITGAGRAFCAGGDLLGFQTDLAAPTTAPFLDKLRQGQRVFDKVEALPMPVIAAVNGYAIAGGLELVLCCDMVIAAESARLGDGHARYGIIPGGGASARLPRKISANRASYMLLTAELLPAATLEQWGLVNQVVADDTLLDAAAAMAKLVTRHSPLGMKVIKGLQAHSTDSRRADAVEAEITAFADYAASADLREGLAAFAGKRKPVFTGK